MTTPFVLLLLAAIALSGCGLGVIGHRTDPRDRGPQIKASEVQRGDRGSQIKAPEVQRGILEAREQAKLNAAEPYWTYRLGQLYLAADSLPQGEAALKACLERQPHYVPALALLSKRYYDSRRHQEAVDMLEGLRSRPDAFPGGFPAVLAAGLALHYDALDRVDLARALVGSADTDLMSTSSAAVFVTLRGANPQAAVGPAAAAVQKRPESAVNQNNYGITRLRAGDPISARRAFLRAIELDPDLPGPYYNLAILERYYGLDDPAAANWFKSYRQRSQQDPDSLSGVFEKHGPQNLAGEER